MFTGIIQKMGTVAKTSFGTGLSVEIKCTPWNTPLERGESIAVNGVCLTVAKVLPDGFAADVLGETLRCTTFSNVFPGMRVNLERAMRVGDALGGHIVQGHVDAKGRIAAIRRLRRDVELEVICSRAIAAGIVLKGSIAVNGVSLTVSDVSAQSFKVNLIPTTLNDTILGTLRVGDEVNLETDVLGKYAAKKSASIDGNGRGLTEEFLAENGFL